MADVKVLRVLSFNACVGKTIGEGLSTQILLLVLHHTAAYFVKHESFSY